MVNNLFEECLILRYFWAGQVVERSRSFWGFFLWGNPDGTGIGDGLPTPVRCGRGGMKKGGRGAMLPYSARGKYQRREAHIGACWPKKRHLGVQERRRRYRIFRYP
ncbi:hypothetical protein KP509_39G005600 [Ceratopteris richardii]|uniref:Uncharacterized protein n=1 Tax=Ceratopteris richardii TaxID=49495 RepID=A0A8T2PYF8_CERRI|nr:hypothetical protein KP509_39G005600 [Ceratopteris richardii]